MLQLTEVRRKTCNPVSWLSIKATFDVGLPQMYVKGGEERGLMKAHELGMLNVAPVPFSSVLFSQSPDDDDDVLANFEVPSLPSSCLTTLHGFFGVGFFFFLLPRLPPWNQIQDQPADSFPADFTHSGWPGKGDHLHHPCCMHPFEISRT